MVYTFGLWIFFVHKKNLQKVGHLLEVKADFLVIDVTPETDATLFWA